MKMKSLLSAITLAVVLVAGSSFAYAYHNHGGSMVDLSAEQQAKYDQMLDSYHNSVRPLHDKLRIKYMELDALQNNVNVKPEKISDLIKEIASLEDEISTKRDNFADNVQEKLGVNVHHGRHYGQGGNCGKRSSYSNGCNRDNYGHNHNGSHRGGHYRGNY